MSEFPTYWIGPALLAGAFAFCAVLFVVMARRSSVPPPLFSSSLVIDVETFGPRLRFAELEALLSANPELVRAVQQVCVFRREMCQRAVEDKSNILHGQTSFEAGAAAGMSDLMATLETIRQGRAGADGQLKQWFGE